MTIINTRRPDIGTIDDQFDGLACIVCGRDLADPNLASVPAGRRERGQVFACAHHHPQVGETVHEGATVAS